MNDSNHLTLTFDQPVLSGSIPQRFAKVVHRFGGRPALIHDSQQLTYTELDAASNQVANWLLSQNLSTDQPIALLFGQGIRTIIALLGVLKAGWAFSALESFAPDERNTAIVEDLQCRLILTEPAYVAQARRLAHRDCRAVDVFATIGEHEATDPDLAISPHALAVISYTSGSTGTPIGVERSHSYYAGRAALNMQYYESKADDVFSLLTHLSHISATMDVFTSILCGAALCIYDLKWEGAQGLKEWIIKHGLTHIHLPNTALRILSESLAEDESLPSIRCLHPSFRLYTKEIESLWKHLPEGAFIVHGLGASETGMICRLKLYRDNVLQGAIVPVGYPLPGVEIRLVDEAGQPVAPGKAGEIWVRSPFLARRYWRRPELTEEKFIPDPQSSDGRVCRLGDLGRLRPDGCLELVGRKDFQVKIRGYRVELEEIEVALERLEMVREAAVVAESHKWGEKRLIAYVVPADLTTVTLRSLREMLHASLPEYMVPFRFELRDALPLLANGKVDRSALTSPGMGRPELDTPFVAPRTTLEADVASIWEAILELDQVGIYDRFTDLGGNSLHAARIVSRILSEFRVVLSLSKLFESPTVADMALAITQQLSTLLDRDTLEQLLAEVEEVGNRAPNVIRKPTDVSDEE